MLTNTLRNRVVLVASLTSLAALSALATVGCTHSDSRDPNAAPYGAVASPSGSPAPVALPSADAAAPTVAPAASGVPGGIVAVPSGAGVSGGAPAPAGGPAAGGPGGGGPMMGGMGSAPTAPLTATPELDAKIADAEKGGNKAAIAAAYAERGTFRMNDPDAGARVKYRAALADYRKALKVDPANAEATHNKDLIEGIYKQMGRPIPQ